MPEIFGYPRPQLERSTWTYLNSAWDFALDREAVYRLPSDVRWNARITVPFAPETPVSGIGDTGFYQACWYRRSFDAPSLQPGDGLIVHFGAVDFCASVWINNRAAGTITAGQS